MCFTSTGNAFYIVGVEKNEICSLLMSVSFGIFHFVLPAPIIVCYFLSNFVYYFLSFIHDLCVLVQNVSHTVEIRNEIRGSRHKTGEVHLTFSGMEVDPMILTSHSSQNGKHRFMLYSGDLILKLIYLNI